jgi:hypothetical protein
VHLRHPIAGIVFALAAVVCQTLAPAALAHEGPPYPILVDEPVAGWLVSVWGDPDVGTGTFYVILDPADDAAADDATDVPPLPEVEVWVQPVTGRLKKVTWPAGLDRERQFLAEPHFDQQEAWKVGFLLHHPDGTTSEVVAEVQVTPPGYGRWDLVIYLIPFLLFGGLWAVALLRRWRQTPASAQTPPAARLSEQAADV